MSKMNLRHQPRVSYLELEEPSWDEYVFCAKCADHFYEFCSIHGPLPVVPDDAVPAKSPYPPYVPRAALTIPHVFLHIAPSIIPGAGLGIFSTLTLPSGVRFGPYKGFKIKETNSMYCWQIYDRNRKPSFMIDAQDANKSNWMRYVNCSRHWSEQNLIAYQYKGQLYYRTIKVIPRFTELMVFYGAEYACMLGIDLRLYNKPLDSLQKYGPPAKRRKIDSTPQKEEQMKMNKTEKGSKPSNNATDTSLPNNISNISKDRPTFSNSSSQNSIPTLNLGISKNILNMSEVKPNIKSVVAYNKELHTNNKIIAPKVCNSNTENDISKQFPSKCVDVIASCSSLDSKNENNKPNIVNNSKKVLERKHLCHICQSKFSTKSHLNVHMRIHTGDKPYKCDICDFRCSQGSNLNVHLRKHTGDKSYKCDICDFRCSQRSYLNIHLRNHTGDKPYKCDICDFRCSQRSNLNLHLRNHTGDKPYKCDICDFRCSQRSYLNIHLRKHTGDKPYKCDICDYRCSQKCSLNVHLRKHTGDKPYKCDICDFRCSQRSNLNLHLRNHTGDKPYKCDICDFRCSQRSYLNIHLRKHTGDKPYKCDICDYRCSQKCSLNVHLRKHTGDKPYKCDICDYRCSRRDSLNIHLRKHSGDKPYKCDMCDYRSTKKCNLNVHLRKHTGDKPYKCDICDYRCSRRDSLNIHLRKHSGDKPYKCDICDYRSSQKYSLITHIEYRHTKEKTHSCHICPYKCITKSNLNVHLRKHTKE